MASITVGHGNNAVSQVNAAVHRMEGNVYRLVLSWMANSSVSSYRIAVYRDHTIDAENLVAQSSAQLAM